MGMTVPDANPRPAGNMCIKLREREEGEAGGVEEEGKRKRKEEKEEGGKGRSDRGEEGIGERR
jgi:hypothetical protein